MRKYIFSDRYAGLVRSPIPFFNAEKALQFLRDAASDYNSLVDLRMWASRQGSGLRDDSDLLEYAAKGLVSGELVAGTLGKVAARDRTMHALKGGGASKEQQHKAPPEPLKSGETTTPSALREPREEPKPDPKPAPAPAMDVAQQVAVLLAAAKSGAPFCEQCEKAGKR